MRLFSCLGAALAVALPLLFGSRSASAAPPPATPKVLQIWTSKDKGFFYTFSDAADGSLSIDKDYASQKQTLFNGVSVVLFDNGSLVFGTIQATQLTPIAVLAEVNTSDLTYTLGHFKSSDGKTFFDGSVNASSDLKTAFFEGTLTEIGQDPKASKTTHIELSLAAPASNTTPPSGNTVNPGTRM
jgi:hypothetical protein